MLLLKWKVLYNIWKNNIKWVTLFIQIAIHALISTHPSHFDKINHKIINHGIYLDLFTKLTYWVQHHWKLAWKWAITHFGPTLATNIETNKHCTQNDLSKHLWCSLAYILNTESNTKWTHLQRILMFSK